MAVGAVRAERLQRLLQALHGQLILTLPVIGVAQHPEGEGFTADIAKFPAESVRLKAEQDPWAAAPPDGAP